MALQAGEPSLFHPGTGSHRSAHVIQRVGVGEWGTWTRSERALMSTDRNCSNSRREGRSALLVPFRGWVTATLTGVSVCEGVRSSPLGVFTGDGVTHTPAEVPYLLSISPGTWARKINPS